MKSIVIDSSVLVELFTAGPRAAACYQLLADAPALYTLCAPDGLYYEVAGALNKWSLRTSYATGTADIATLLDLHIETTSCRNLALEAWQITQLHRVGSYDSFYLALAQRIGAPLYTVDVRLMSAIGKNFDVRPAT